MVRIRIGDEERLLKDARPNWINDQIDRRREDGVVVCVKVFIEKGPINIVLSTPACSGGLGGGRPLRDEEKEIFDLWEKRGLNDDSFTGGNLVAFLKQLSKWLD